MAESVTFSAHDLDLDGATARMWQGGSGVPLLLLHGVGPGTCTHANFGRILEPLAERFTVLATDLIGFGQSSAKPAPPFFDYDLWLRQAERVLGIVAGPVLVLGHSISASLALRLAARHERVAGLLLSCPMATAFPPSPLREQLWTYPETRADLRASLEILFARHDLITDEMLDARLAVLGQPGFRERFDAIFAGDKQALLATAIVPPDELRRVRCPVTIIHGREDRAFPVEDASAGLLPYLPHADLHALARCGHGPAVERTEDFLTLAIDFFTRAALAARGA